VAGAEIVNRQPHANFMQLRHDRLVDNWQPASHFRDRLIVEDLQRYWWPANPLPQLVVELTERDALPVIDQTAISVTVALIASVPIAAVKILSIFSTSGFRSFR
jgi:hypothetical protein